ncbi:MAG: hypothetical protein ACAF41_09085 [Leptolyngbya sp. BL-A-14]
MKKLETVKNLEELGRVQLSKSFFMREFLYSEISQIEGIPNIPDDPDLAIAAGKKLCENVLEPIQDALGRISVRSAYRSCEVNQRGNEKGFNCAENEKNYAGHIWDRRDGEYMGATACVIVTSFLPYYDRTKDWTTLAWWIHDNIKAYANMTFFPKYAAFNITWHENSNYPKYIYSYAENSHTGKNSGYLTKKDMDNFSGSHQQFYQEFIQQLHI